MTVFKITQDHVTVSCRCGNENEFLISELKLVGNSIYFECPSDGCPGIGTLLCGDYIFASPIKSADQEICQTLGKRLFDAGQIDKNVPVKESFFAIAKEWHDGDTLEVSKINYVSKRTISSTGEVVS